MTEDVVLATERLAVRRAGEADVAFLVSLWNNPAVMRHVGFPVGLGILSAEIADQLERQARRDFPLEQVLLVALRASEETLGQCKMGAPDSNGISETDIKLAPAYWGRGYGVELKRALVDYLFTRTDCLIVQATPNVANVASIKMQEAVGGERVGEATYEFPPEMSNYTAPVHHYIYHVRRERWEKQR